MIYFFIGIISCVYLINRFCLRKSLGRKFRNRFVVSHFCYYLVNLFMLTPFYLCSLLYSISNTDKRKDYYESMKIAVIASFLLGFAMLFVRVQETSNWKISCKKFLFSTSSDTDLLINPDQPLTAIINKTMNLEFICCILNGLTQISQKREKNDSIRVKEEKKEVTTISISQVIPGGITNNQSNLDMTNSMNAPNKKKKKM